MASYSTPGVYVEEISTLPPSVAEVATAVPAFIGYTKNGPDDKTDPMVKRIGSLLEFETDFGGAPPAEFEVNVSKDIDGIFRVGPVTRTETKPQFWLYYALKHYFKNGGGPCYVVSVGNYASSSKDKGRFMDGLSAIEKEDEPTLIVLTDAVSLKPAEYYEIAGEALGQCKKLGDRFTIIDVHEGKTKVFRDDPGLSINLLYGAAYTPYLNTTLNYIYSGDDVTVVEGGGTGSTMKSFSTDFGQDVANGLTVSYSGSVATPKVNFNLGAASDDITFILSSDTETLAIKGVKEKTATQIVAAWEALTASIDGFNVVVIGSGASNLDSTTTATELATAATSDTMTALVEDAKGDPVANPNTDLHNKIKTALADQRVVLPPSAAMAGIYARVDREQGVWKAPANTGVMSVLGPATKITNEDQDLLNIDPTAGKSINAIRAFTGKGTLVWGARTLAGNDNEWRYISVRRLFITIEESTRKASAFAVFEANDQSTWLKVKAMIESYLYGLWEQGALAGSKPEAAYYVHVGLGTTMTPQDVLEGRMKVEIGIAAVRPAEFIILRFSHKLQTA